MKIRTLALATILAAASASAGFAQNDPSPSATSTTPGSQMTEESAASENDGSQAGATGDFNMFMKNFGAAGFTSANSGIDAGTSFNIVHLSNLANADKTALGTAMDPMKGQIADLTTRVSQNKVAVDALAAEGFAPLDVVYATVGDNGAVTLYIDDIDKKTN